jgi:two-component system response regulator TctD
MRILLVEDNLSLANWMARSLTSDQFSVDLAHNGADADHLLHTQAYDLVILDLSLPKLGGHEVLKRLRARENNVPVLILTATNTIEGRIQGLNEGADDYMAKPFDLNELEARIRAILRRFNQNKNPVLQCGSLRYDSNTRVFALGDKALALTPRERAVLETLIVKLGKTVSKQSIADSLFAMSDTADPDAIEIYVSRLRKKLEHSDAAIITLRGLGYLLKQRHA